MRKEGVMEKEGMVIILVYGIQGDKNLIRNLDTIIGNVIDSIINIIGGDFIVSECRGTR